MTLRLYDNWSIALIFSTFFVPAYGRILKSPPTALVLESSNRPTIYYRQTLIELAITKSYQKLQLVHSSENTTEFRPLPLNLS